MNLLMNVKKCLKCGKCCYSNAGPFIFPQDVERISNYLYITPCKFLLDYCISNNLHIEGKDLKIYSTKIQNGKCIFLDDNNLCKIFKCRPYQCINAPYNFLANYSFWKHMKCISPEDFKDIDSSENDKKIFSEILDDGYKKYLRR